MSSDRWRLTRRYMGNVLHHWRVFAGMVVCMVAAGILQPLLPWGLAPLLDAAAAQKDYPVPAAALPYFMLAVIFLLGVFSYGRSYLGGWLDATLQRDYRGKMAHCMLHLPLARLQQDASGMATSRFMLFLPQLTGGLQPVCLALVQETIRAGGYIALMFYWQWQLTLIVLLAAPIGAGMIRLLGRRMKKIAAAQQTAIAAAQGKLGEAVSAAPLMKMAGADAGGRHLHGAFNTLRGKVLRINVLTSAAQPLTHFLLALPFAAVVGFIVGDLSSGSMTAGQAASFLTAMLLLPTPVRIITRSMNTWEQMLVAAREIYGYMDSAAEPDAGTQPLERAAVRGAVDFRGISFRYDNSAKEVLSDFSLHIAAGETVALVGHSGAGKTTLCNLLPRFFLPQRGAVQLDGTDINTYALAALRRQIMLVTQEPHLFAESVAANVAFPDDAAAQPQRIAQALRAAEAEAFVRALPQGADTMIGEGGAQLSGGQQQRLMLARAFYWDAPLVILDEPTSALDSETEDKIKTALRALLKGRTAILIAHRFATLDLADRIAVMDGGKLLATGTVQELRKTCPLFAAMYEAQSLGG